jgi:catechol 2,3-dioxygenase-like lactoylglutathione lyase family enzyme
MVANAPMTTILPVKDPERARRFYEERLGLAYKGRSGDGKHLFAAPGGGTLALLESSAEPVATTALSFEVGEIVAAIADLKNRGITFEDYDLPDFKTVDHVCILGSEKAAWFLDTEGNTLCIHELIPG